jgi:phosphopantothenoylcysteine synthetase/decarboxylase
MKFLVTAGNSQSPIDRVRCITNIFSGRTGAQIALEANARGHDVVLVTSHPEAVQATTASTPSDLWQVKTYRTFEELERVMEATIAGIGLDAIIHCAAVNDYRSAGIFAPGDGTRFDEEAGTWKSDTTSGPQLEDRSAGKVKSTEPELWLRLIRTPKIVDRIRRDWGFQRVLVKFKLEVEMSDEQLLRIAESSRQQSAADLIVANTLEGMHTWAYIGPIKSRFEKVSRRDLPARLIAEIEAIRQR